MFLLFLFNILITVAADTSRCERLQASLTYTQEEAPRDLSGLVRIFIDRITCCIPSLTVYLTLHLCCFFVMQLPVVVQRINQVLDGVVDVEVEWTGADLHGRVGEHMVETKVTRHGSDADTLVTQCFQVPFRILDTNECLLPEGHWMRHKCHSSSVCINTLGSYECMCPSEASNLSAGSTVENLSVLVDLIQSRKDPWELSFNTSRLTSCPALPSTHGCCPDRDQLCRAAFRCPEDPCLHHDCVSTAKCEKTASPVDNPNYTCRCPSDLMGNGHRCREKDEKPAPKVRYDGVTPTEETIRNNFYCDCTKPVIDACSGFPPCKGKHQICLVGADNAPYCGCKPGYVYHEKYGCVDKSPPVLRLKKDLNGDHTTRLRQGDVYQESAVEIQDENAEEYMRSLKIAYSRPIPHGCFTQMGEFHVNYTIATPWTTPPFVQVTRRVVIDDIDECSLDPKKYESTCPSLVPRCDVAAGAKCVNTRGSYTCKCPPHTTGDGFLEGVSFGSLDPPTGFHGGTSCIDTSKPVIKLQGPNPKVFSVCACSGVLGVMDKSKDKSYPGLQKSQQDHYSHDIKVRRKKWRVSTTIPLLWLTHDTTPLSFSGTCS